MIEDLPRRIASPAPPFEGANRPSSPTSTNSSSSSPVPNPTPIWRLDRWLLAAECNGIEPLIIADKRDRADETTFQERFGAFARIGYRVLATSAKQALGIEELRGALRGRMLPPSPAPPGSANPACLNALQPGLQLDTGDIGKVTFEGRHTTCARTPPPRQRRMSHRHARTARLELLHLDRDALLEGFIEFHHSYRALPLPQLQA